MKVKLAKVFKKVLDQLIERDDYSYTFGVRPTLGEAVNHIDFSGDDELALLMGVGRQHARDQQRNAKDLRDQVKEVARHYAMDTLIEKVLENLPTNVVEESPSIEREIFIILSEGLMENKIVHPYTIEVKTFERPEAERQVDSPIVDAAVLPEKVEHTSDVIEACIHILKNKFNGRISDLDVDGDSKFSDTVFCLDKNQYIIVSVSHVIAS